jgi:hypothetical protein
VQRAPFTASETHVTDGRTYSPIAKTARGRTRSFRRRMPRRNRYGLLFEDIHPQTGALWGNLRRVMRWSDLLCRRRRYRAAWKRYSRGWKQVRMIASRPCRQPGAFRTQLRDSASRLRAGSRHREGCRTLVARCHAADTQNICNAISSMRPAVGLLKERRFALACNVLGRHEIFSAPLVRPRSQQHGKERREQIFPL